MAWVWKLWRGPAGGSGVDGGGGGFGSINPLADGQEGKAGGAGGPVVVKKPGNFDVAGGAGRLGGGGPKIIAAGGGKGKESLDVFKKAGGRGAREGGLAGVGVEVGVEELGQKRDGGGSWKASGERERALAAWAKILKIRQGKQPADDVGLLGKSGGGGGHEGGAAMIVKGSGAKFGGGQQADGPHAAI